MGFSFYMDSQKNNVKRRRSNNNQPGEKDIKYNGKDWRIEVFIVGFFGFTHVDHSLNRGFNNKYAMCAIAGSYVLKVFHTKNSCAVNQSFIEILLRYINLPIAVTISFHV